jgi:preprotein translocase subunit YajC
LESCNGQLNGYIPREFSGPRGPFFDHRERLMFVTPAYAQTAGSSTDFFGLLVPFVLILPVLYFFMIRPQQQQLKKRQEMLKAVRRGDTVVTGGGLIGKVTKVIGDDELEIDLGGGTKVTALRNTLSDVRVKGEPVANQNVKK